MSEILGLFNSVDISDDSSFGASTFKERGKWAKLWLFDIQYRTADDDLTVQLTFKDGVIWRNHSKSFAYSLSGLKTMFREGISVFYMNEVDCVGLLLIEMYLYDRVRDELVDNLSRDVFTSLRTTIMEDIHAGKLQNTLEIVKQAFLNIEVQYKHEVIDSHITSLREEHNDDISQCFRLLEVQKAMYQLETHDIVKKSGNVYNRIDQLTHKRSPKTAPDNKFNCDCALL